MVVANVASDSPMVVSDPLGGFYYLWWDVDANELVLAPECPQMRKIIGQASDANKTIMTAHELLSKQEQIMDMILEDETPSQSLSERADLQRLVNAISGCLEGVTKPCC